jgi:hypothetical protein
MGKIYVDQSNLRVTLDTGVSCLTALDMKIKYTDPDGTSGEWDASLHPTNNNYIYYDLQSDELFMEGVWTFWAYVTFTDGRSAPGEPLHVRVYEEGDCDY